MARYTGPIAKLARREGAPVDGSDKTLRILQKKNYPPGEQGDKRRFGKPSEYSRQLREKQKAKRTFGILEKQFKKYYYMADKVDGVTGLNMLKLLETRLDNAVFRAGFAKTRRQARQMASHALLTLNGKRVKTPSILVKEGDVIKPREKSLTSPLFADIAKAKIKAPKWLKIDQKATSIEVVNMPDENDIEQGIESQLIVEFYSK
jgi:small subunit ribosomal protein S4